MDSSSHLGAELADDNAHLTRTTESMENQLKVQIKVEISSMARNERKQQTLNCWDEFFKEFLVQDLFESVNSKKSQVYVLYEPVGKLKPYQFVDTNVFAGRLLERNKEVYFAKFDEQGQTLYSKVSLPPSETVYRVGINLVLGKVEAPEEVQPDVVFPPCWLVDNENRRLGGGRGNWVKY